MANSVKRDKVRVTIDLDKDVVDYFKMLGHKDERPYQPLMNRVLRDYVEAKVNGPTSPQAASANQVV